MLRRHQHHSACPTRRGVTVPMVAIALVVLLGFVALVLDRMWLEAARVELTTAAEAAGLAALRELASDETLKEEPDWELLQAAARRAAGAIAAENRANGDPVELKTQPFGDVRFGHRVHDPEENRYRFQEVDDDDNASSVLVVAQRTRRRNNPIALFIDGLTRVPFGDVRSQAEVTLDNRIVALRPYEGAVAPALPLAIKARSNPDDKPQERQDWETLIERRGGLDRWSINDRGEVTEGADGLPEMTLISQKPNDDDAKDANLRLLDIVGSWQADALFDQYRDGIHADHLEAYGGELRLGGGQQETISSTAVLQGDDHDALKELVGQARIAMLYDPLQSVAGDKSVCTEFVAIRILDVQSFGDRYVLLIQPAVVSTRTAVLADGMNETDGNRYLYKIQVTY